MVFVRPNFGLPIQSIYLDKNFRFLNIHEGDRILISSVNVYLYEVTYSNYEYGE